MNYILWTVYLVAVLLTMLLKMLKFMHDEVPQHVTFKMSVSNYFFGGVATQLSTISIFGVEWLIGAVYIDHLPFVFGDYLSKMPTHPAIAFTLGSLGEVFAPIGINWLSKRIFPEG